MIRYLLFALAFGFGCLASELISAADEPQVTNNPQPGVTVADLEQSLKSGLKARRPIEFNYIKLVVQKVKTKELPIDLVQSTFMWARRHQPYPYPYFERGLRERAAKQGIALPAGL